MKTLLALTLTLLSLTCISQIPEIKISVGHVKPIQDVCYSSDERIIASLSFNEIKIWETQSRKEITTFSLEGLGFPKKILFTPDGKKVIIGKYDVDGINTIDINSGKIEKIKIEGNWGFGFLDMALAPNGEYLAISTDEVLHLLRMPDFKLIKSVKILNIVKGLAFNNASNEIFIGVSDGVYVKYNIGDSKVIPGNLESTSKPHRVSFAPDLNKLYTANSDYSFNVWSINEKKLIKTILKPDFAFPVVDLNNNTGALIVGGTKDKMVRFYSSPDDEPILLGPHNSEVQLAKFSPSGKLLTTTTSSWYNENERHSLRLWDASNGNALGQLGDASPKTDVLAITEKSIASRQNDKIIIWDLESNDIRSIKLNKNYKDLFMNSTDSIYSLDLISKNKYAITDISRNKIILNFDLEINPDMKVRFWLSDNLKWAIVIGLKYYLPNKAEEIVKVFDLEKGTLKTEFMNNKVDLVDEISFINANKAICLISHDFATNKGKIRVVDLETNKLTTPFKIPFWSKTTVLESTTMLNISKDKAVKLDVINGSKNEIPVPLDSFKVNSTSNILRSEHFYFLSTRFIPTSKRLLIAHGHFINIVNLTSGGIEATLSLSSKVGEMYLINGDSILAAVTDDGSIEYWDLQKRKQLVQLINYSEKEWLVKTPEGLFDGSAGAMERLYFVNGLNIIEFSQLKERYYEPRLLKKIIKGENLRSTVGFKSIDLPPDIRVGKIDAKGYLPIELTNKGGGIGEVAVYIHGKEVTKDARDQDANPDVPILKILYYVGNHKNFTEGDNFIGVKAWNKAHWVESRATTITYTIAKKDSYQSAVHIFTCGISDYAGGAEIDLTYAAKDSEDMSRALKLGAAKLFGTQRSYVYNLTSSQARESWPTKENILKIFERISTTAHPLDVIVVYLSGHGINIGGPEGDWHYLTQEAFTANPAAYSDPAIRKQTTISSNELVELFKTIPATKQVLIMDACASGKLVDNLIAKKDIPSSTLRALDRMKDRTGMHIITGCAADAVSYEASRYGQGILTYSLLEGIRGAALREDEFVDVNKLFQYAQERVPVLAKGIGGIQTPMIFSPNGSQSFDIGQFTQTEKKEVPISRIRPVYIQSNFQDEDEMSDILGLGKKVDQLLGESAARGTEAPLIFVPVREYPDGCQLVGRYKKENGKIVLKLKKKCESKDLLVDIAGSDINDLSSQVFKVINE